MTRIEDYINETPDRLADIVAAADRTFTGLDGAGIRRVLLTGSGTSFHSALQMEQAVRQASGVEVHAVYPFALTPELVRDGRGTLLVGISQAGGSLSTFEAMRTAKAAGCTIATMCGEENAYIDQLADHTFLVRVGEETAGAKTKGYYGTKLTLLLLGQAIGRANGHLGQADVASTDEHLAELGSRFPGVVATATEWVEGHLDEFASAEDIRIVGPASLYGDTLEVALKILETLRVPTSGYEFDEFIHGIYNAVNEKSFVVILDDGSEPRVQKMVEVLGGWTDHVHVVGSEASASADLQLGRVADDQATFLFPIAGQLISALVPWKKGYDPSIPKDPHFHDKLASKSH